MKNRKKHIGIMVTIGLLGLGSVSFHAYQKTQYTYDDFETPGYCRQCHDLFYEQWDQALMSDAYSHEWDEIEYFQLAVPHSEKDPSMLEAQEGCNGCHTPMAYLSGDVPPPDPKTNPRANESVSCDVCHTITGYSGDIPFNFNYVIEPGKTKYSSKKRNQTSPNHQIDTTRFYAEAELCGICHNEKSPFDVWVKSTHLELIEGPYYKEGVVCQDCHMPEGPAKVAKMGDRYDNASMHLFNGAHDPGKILGTVEIRIAPHVQGLEPGEPLVLTVTLYNQKTGHKFPTGSVEDRIVWLHVEAIDESGKVYHIPVDEKGFEGEEYTIAGEALAYQDIGIPLGIENFEGLRREMVPVGDRIFRMPYFDPEGRMTMMQWNTASLGVDYRIGPRETKVETYTFNVPFDITPGELTIKAVMYYRLLVRSVGEYLNVPESEYTAMTVNEQETTITVYP